MAPLQSLLVGLFAASTLEADAATSQMKMKAKSTMKYQALLHKHEHAHKKNMAKLMSNMTLHGALESLHHGHHSGSKAVAMVQEALEHKSHAKHHRTHKHLRSHSTSDPSGYAAVQPAIDEINKMVKENQQKYDMELHKCCMYDEIQSAVIEESRQDIALFNAEASECYRDILQADGVIELCEDKLPELDDALNNHKAECAAERKELHDQLKIIKGDLNVMSDILKLTDCKDEANKPTFLQMRRCVDGCAYYNFEHPDLHNLVSHLQAADSRQILHENLDELMEHRDDPATTTTSEPPKPWAPDKLPDMTMKRSSPCKEPVANDKRTGKCALGPAECKPIHEKFMYIEAGIQDKKLEIEDELNHLNFHCKLQSDNIEAQISDTELKLKDAQTQLAGSTKRMNTAQENSRLKGIELKSLNDDYSSMTESCHNNYQSIESEACGLRKIRGELVKLEGQNNDAFFQDCVVSDWVAGECSATCGGGMREMTREIETHPVGGSVCPALKAQEECNKNKCPIDCVLGDWSGWSSCTAKCGGGVLQRQRSVIVENAHGGEPCGETTEAEACNVQSCDRDCELSDWTPWSPCSKECDGGVETRVRMIKEPPVGEGTCPDMHGIERLNYNECNMFACKPAADTLMCEDTLDIILLIDGSGSIGQSGWDASKAAAKKLITAFKGTAKSDNRIAVMLYSWDTEVVQHFTDDFDGTSTKIDSMDWPASVTFTGRALNTARNELSLGRADAQSIVIVITDGRPMSTRYTSEASANLRQYARLMWVPVTRWAPLADIKNWASYPKNDNILPITDFTQLEESETISEIVADACQHVS